MKWRLYRDVKEGPPASEDASLCHCDLCVASRTGDFSAFKEDPRTPIEQQKPKTRRKK